ncbi:MAG TPA: transglycosylase SLT domain-containing protein [Alphaproteobacteria bacterium]
MKRTGLYWGVVFWALSCAGLAQAASDPAPLTDAEEQEIEALALPAPQAWIGDFDGMRTRRVIRILVPYSKTFYFVDKGRELGIEHDLGVGFQDGLNKKFNTKSLRIQVAFIPVARDELLARLIGGYGDIAAGGLTVTPARQKLVDFVAPMASGVREVVVLGRNAPPIESLDDLSGREILVRKSSSYFEHLLELNRRMGEAGKKGIVLVPADEDLEDEDLLEMANAGLLSFVVVDRYKGNFWARIFKDIKVRDDLMVNSGGDIAWAVRKNSPLLRGEIDAFFKTHKVGSQFGNTLVKRYLENTKYVKNATSAAEMKRFAEMVGLFEKYGQDYNFDPLMIMAQGFQESGLNQGARSPRGAVGVMQLLPSTAADPAIGIKDIESDASQNIHAGAKYLRHLIEEYLDEPGLSEKDRVLMAFAAYNAGPGNLRKMRRLAQKSGLDQNVWFLNVEVAAARLVGNETVQYVGNIYKYYMAYKLTKAREAARQESLPAATP